jgi:hypothetical protein
MEIALGISMTSATVRMVLVEGDKADGLTVECDQFSTSAGADEITTSTAEQVSAAILATQQSASRQGHHLSMCGIALSDECDPGDIRESLAARGVGDVVVIGERQAAAALAHTVARAIGYTETALLLVQERAATLSLLHSVDRSVGDELSRNLQSADVNFVLTEMIADLNTEGAQGLFVVDASGRLSVIKPCVEAATNLPIIFPEEPEWALARGAALAAAAAPRFEASTTGLAYAQDPDEEDFTDAPEYATGALLSVDETTKRGVLDVIRWESTGDFDSRHDPSFSVRRLVPVASLAASVAVVGVVAVVMALAASTAPRSTEHLVEREQILPTEPSTIVAPAPPPSYEAAATPNPAPVEDAPPPPPPPALPPTAPPVTVAVQQAPGVVEPPSHTVKVQAAQPVAAAQAPVAPKPVAAAPVDPPQTAAPDRVDPPPAAAPIPLAAPAPPIAAVAPPAPAVQVPQVLPQITLGPPVNQDTAAVPQAPILRWLPSFLRPQQQAPQWQPPAQQSTPPVQQWTPPAQQYTPPARQYSPPVQQWTPPAQQYTPPVQQYSPPAQQWTPPAQQYSPPARQYTPPAQQWTPPPEQYTPPVRQYTPPAQQWTPPAQQYTPPAQQWTPSPQTPSGSEGFGGGTRGRSGGGVPFWPYQ